MFNTQQIPLVNVRSNISIKAKKNEYTACLALDERTRHDAFALRYDSYLDSGFIAPNSTRSFQDKFDDMSNSSIIVIYSDDKAVASVRACFLSRRFATTSPGRETFPEEVDQLLQAAQPSRHDLEGVEVTRLVRSPEAANNQGLVFLLYRLAGHLALLNDFQVVLSCVRQNHVPFYKRLRFKEVSPLKPYPGLSCPMQMLASPRADYDEVRAGFPIMDSEAGPAGSLDGFLTGQVVSVPLLHRT